MFLSNSLSITLRSRRCTSMQPTMVWVISRDTNFGKDRRRATGLLFSRFTNSVGWISWKFQVRKPHSVDHDLIRANRCHRLESSRPSCRHEVILIHAVATYAQSSDKDAILIERFRTGEKYDTALVRHWPRRARHL